MFNKAKWHKFSLYEQMSNIASEIHRTFYWKNKDKVEAETFAENVLELFDLTIEDKRWRLKLGEILKIRSVFCDTFFELGNFAVSEQTFKQYFMPFVILYNLNREKKLKSVYARKSKVF